MGCLKQHTLTASVLQPTLPVHSQFMLARLNEMSINSIANVWEHTVFNLPAISIGPNIAAVVKSIHLQTSILTWFLIVSCLTHHLISTSFQSAFHQFICMLFFSLSLCHLYSECYLCVLCFSTVNMLMTFQCFIECFVLSSHS